MSRAESKGVAHLDIGLLGRQRVVVAAVLVALLREAAQALAVARQPHVELQLLELILVVPKLLEQTEQLLVVRLAEAREREAVAGLGHDVAHAVRHLSPVVVDPPEAARADGPHQREQDPQLPDRQRPMPRQLASKDTRLASNGAETSTRTKGGLVVGYAPWRR
eukprot:2515819-Rhodomonas_salina.2